MVHDIIMIINVSGVLCKTLFLLVNDTVDFNLRNYYLIHGLLIIIYKHKIV
jgi:hypothetical protein